MTDLPDYEDLAFAYEREKRARLHSEQILQTQTRRMYQINMQLNSTNTELHKHQRTAIQQEKLAALGRLTAGVAHEVNNPLAFTIGNLQILQKYVQLFSELIAKTLEGPLTPASIDQLLQAHFPNKSLAYLQEDANHLIEESLTGLLRVREIVGNLKTFSRADDSTRMATDINQSIRAAVTIIEAKIIEHHRLTLELGELPITYTNPNHLTQVVLNLLSNALDALDGNKQGEIAIRTRVQNQHIIIEVSDNGCGMSEETKHNLFLPFFTTKPFGQGTGLGLSICYDKVTALGGTIECSSELNQGTRFLIRLPAESRQKARDPKQLGAP